MGKSLVIVESPSKARIINRYLGDDYVVKASVGHIRDLPAGGTKKNSAKTASGKKSAKEQKVNPLYERMGINPEKNWEAHYEIMAGKEKVVSELKKLAKEADAIYLATDLDREGEAIAWHLQEVLGGRKERYLRVKYPEITKAAITKAFENPGTINMDLVNAQQTRRFLDRVVGFMVSPLLWSKVARGLSAGRVQSVAVELIVDREHEIKSFIPEEYWSIDALTITPGSLELKLALATIDGAKADIKNEAQAQAVAAALKHAEFIVEKVEAKKGSTHPAPAFTTSTLQQTANQKLGFSVKKTMTLAQRLYENGYITYMRTDSVNLSNEAVSAARDIIRASFGSDYLPQKPNFFKSKESAQEAHEAIRPSHPELKAENMPDSMERDERRLYKLIYDRYLACQMSDQIYETTTVNVRALNYGFKAVGRVVLFDGFRKIWPANSKDEEIPPVKALDKLSLKDVICLQHFTQPPAHYSEASLVRELEKDGIGRPSTYASIIATIQDRGYVRLERGRFYAEKMGEIVTARLKSSFAKLMDLNFTAKMETELDEVASGRLYWIDSLNTFYKDFSKTLEQAKKPMDEGGMADNRPLVIDITCPKCHKYKMALHSGRTGNFLACQGYYDKNVPKEARCTKTLNLKEINLNAFGRDLSEEEEAELMRRRKRCPLCGTAMDSFLMDGHTKIHICGRTPHCNGYLLETGDFNTEIDNGPKIDCERCGCPMELKEGRFGRYMACTNHECGNTRKILKNGEVAPPREAAVELPELLCKAKGSHYVLRDGATGIFLAANNFPRVRETRAPLVSELKRFKDRISSKFYYLAEGPEKDPNGRPVEVRFSRKLKKQYLVSFDDNGRPAFTWYFDEKSSRWNAARAAASSKGAVKKTKTTAKKK